MLCYTCNSLMLHDPTQDFYSIVAPFIEPHQFYCNLCSIVISTAAIAYLFSLAAFSWATWRK